MSSDFPEGHSLIGNLTPAWDSLPHSASFSRRLQVFQKHSCLKHFRNMRASACPFYPADTESQSGEVPTK